MNILRKDEPVPLPLSPLVELVVEASEDLLEVAGRDCAGCLGVRMLVRMLAMGVLVGVLHPSINFLLHVSSAMLPSSPLPLWTWLVVRPGELRCMAKP